MLQDLKNEFISRYLDVNGLGKLQDEAEENVTTIRNENGILFAAIGYYQFRNELNVGDRDRALKSISLLTEKPGLYNRHPGNNVRTEAHDNYAGIAALSILFDLPIAKDICTYGEKYGWQFANTDNTKYSWAQLRQGGDIAFYKICAGYIPYPLEMLWLCCGLIYGMSFGWSSTWNLGKLKLEAIGIALKDKSGIWAWVDAAFLCTGITCFIISYVRKLFPRSYVEYFGEKHVITRMAVRRV